MDNNKLMMTTPLHTPLNGRFQMAGPFFDDVMRGLSANPKRLDSKYFYDAVGDQLFQDIMASPEYYPTNCEKEIFSGQTAAICQALVAGSDEFDLVELGAGDAAKSSYLLKYLLERKTPFTYLPIDISGNIISYLEVTLPGVLPGIRVHGLHGEYFDMLAKASSLSGRPKVVLFLGSNIGNMSFEATEKFCRELRAHLSPGDKVLIGFDLKKNPKTILAAYNDKAGITRNFNLNLLTRINRELNANFNRALFDHYPTYHPGTGECKSYLISLVEQDVRIGNQMIHFDKDEYIDMEISLKFTPEQTERLAAGAGFRSVVNFYDRKNYFLDTLWIAE